MPPKAKLRKGAVNRARPPNKAIVDGTGIDTDVDENTAHAPVPRKKTTALPTDRVTRYSTGSTKPVVNPDNGEIKVPKRTPRKKAPVPTQVGKDAEAKQHAIMQRRAAEDERRRIEDEEMENLTSATSQIRAPRTSKISASSYIVDNSTKDGGHAPDVISAGDPEDYAGGKNVENDDGSFSGDDGGSSGDNGGFSGDEEGEIEFGHDNVDGFGFGDDVSGPRNDFGEGSEHGDDSEDKTPSTDEDHANPANDGFEDTDADATAVQGYGNELLRVPLKRSQLPYSDNESVNNQPTTSKKKRLRRIHSRISLSATPAPNSPLNHVKAEEGSVDFADVSKSSTPQPHQSYVQGNINHEIVLKTTRSLYQLALVTSDPWATISVQDSFVTNAFGIACRQHSTVFVKTPDLHTKIKASHSRIRNYFISAAQNLVPHYYKFVGLPPNEVTAKVALALDKGNYRAKTYNERRSGLYEHPCIAAVLGKAYFEGPKSDGHTHFESFSPLMPVPTLCLAIIAIKAALSEYKTGNRVKGSFTATQWMPEYDVEIKNWNQWAQKDRSHTATSRQILTRLTMEAADSCKHQLIGQDVNMILDDD